MKEEKKKKKHDQNAILGKVKNKTKNKKKNISTHDNCV